MGWRYGTTDAHELQPGQVLRGAESGRRITLERREQGRWYVRLANGTHDWVYDEQMRFFEPVA